MLVFGIEIVLPSQRKFTLLKCFHIFSVLSGFEKISGEYSGVNFLVSLVLLIKSNPSPSSSIIYMEEEGGRLQEHEVMDESRETVSSRLNRINVHENPHRV